MTASANNMGLLWEIIILLLKVFLSYVEFVYRLFVSRKKKCIQDKVVLITGGGRGIGKHGRELAILMAGQGARVALCDIDQQSVQETKEDIRSLAGEAYGYRCDVTNKADVSKMAARIRSDLGEVDILVNNAGILHGKDILDLNYEEIKKTFEVNILSHYLMLQEFLPYMISTDSGHIVQMASASSLYPSPLVADYASTKYAVNGLSEALCLDLRERHLEGINVSIVYPLFANTNMLQSIAKRTQPNIRFGRLMSGREVAECALDGILRNNKYIYVPWDLRFGRLLLNILPDKVIQHILDVAHNRFSHVKNEKKKKY